MMHSRIAVTVGGLLLGGMVIGGGAHAATATRTSAFEYDGATGLLTKEIVEPNITQMRLDTAYTYDAYGNKTAATVSSPATGVAAITPRSSSSSYDSRGEYPLTSTNALNQSESKTFDARFGAITQLTGPNNVAGLNNGVTQWQYDSFGRKTLEKRADGTQTKWDYLYCNGVAGGTTPCPALAKYLVQITPLNAGGTANGAWNKVYFDMLDREVRSETQGFDGTSTMLKDTEYDPLGRVSRASNPYYPGQTPQWTRFTYDAIGRTLAITLPDTTRSSVAYNGLTITTTNALGQTEAKTRNSQGQLVQVKDAANGTLSYQYDPFGNLTQTIDAKGNAVTLAYDQRGRKTGMSDPDMGTWAYGYNALGELIRQTDAKGQVTSLAYDKLGRLTHRAEPDLVSNWTYDSCATGVGKPCTVTTDNGYRRNYSYDSLGRPISTATTIDTNYTASITYDTNGRVATQTYPTGLAIKYVYTASGYLKEVRNNATNALYWRADTMDAQGHLLQQTYGNSVVTQAVFDGATGRLKNLSAGAGNSVQNMSFVYDQIGNMASRSDATQGLLEAFSYDNLNRLTSSTVNSNGAGMVTQTYAYDSLGNITSRSAVGAYAYGAVNARPHALTQITYAGGGKRTYGYDANGSLTNETEYDAAGAVMAGKGRSEAYTSFNMPHTLSGAGGTLTFVYGPDHQRMKQIAPGATTLYLNPDNSGGLSYEKDIKTDGTIEHRHFLTAGGQVIAVIKQSGTGATTVNYFHRDNLGSTTAVTDDTGAVVERLAYEPFGKRRFPVGSMDGNDTIKGIHTDRGFTNHEHLDELGLIHMNGRVYDPMTGRFLSADPMIQAPDDLQSYNRYSYVRNNPLVYVDPSGFSWWNPAKHFAAYVKAHVAPTPQNVFRAVRANPGQPQADHYIMTHQWAYAVGQAVVSYYGGPAGAAFWSGYYTYEATGSINAANRAAAISYATTYAFSYVNGAGWGAVTTVVADGVVGGVSARLQGGSFQDGFIYAAVPAAAMQIYETALPRENASLKTSNGEWAPKDGIDVQPLESGLSDMGMQVTPDMIQTYGPNLERMSWLGRLGTEESSSLRWISANVPGMESISRLHDVWGSFLKNNGMWNVITNVGAMLPAAITTYIGVAGPSGGLALITYKNRIKQNSSEIMDFDN